MLRNNRLIIRRLFGVSIPKGTKVQFDPTTVLLARALAEQLTAEDSRALEIGIGQGALVGLSLKKAAQDRGVELALDGIDCSRSRVESSLKVAEHNRMDVKFWLSDLFEQVPAEQQYDLIFFNPPYVPTGVGNELKLTERLQVDGDQVWDGGEDGTSILRMFVNQAGDYLSARGRVVFGVQEIFVPDARVVEAVGNSRLQIKQRVKKRGIPSIVYVLSK